MAPSKKKSPSPMKTPVVKKKTTKLPSAPKMTSRTRHLAANTSIEDRHPIGEADLQQVTIWHINWDIYVIFLLILFLPSPPSPYSLTSPSFTPSPLHCTSCFPFLFSVPFPFSFSFSLSFFFSLPPLPRSLGLWAFPWSTKPHAPDAISTPSETVGSQCTQTTLPLGRHISM